MIGDVWLNYPDFSDSFKRWVSAVRTDFSQPLTAAQQQVLVPRARDRPSGAESEQSQL